MKKVNSMIFVLVTLVLAMNYVVATDVSEVIIATNVSYADFAVASVAASKIGAALFFVSKNTIPNETLEAINSINPEKVYIIGGPAVVSRSIELELNKSYDVIRIWGMTRYGTSSEVAKYFWSEGSEKAVLVWDLPDSPKVDLDTSLMIVKAAEVAQNEIIPLILIPKNHLTVEIEDALKTLNVSSVKLYGNVGPKVIEELNSLGIEIEERITGEPREVREKIENKIKDMYKNATRPLIVAAVANWQEGLAVRASPHGVSILVFSENEIPIVVEKVKNITSTRNVSKVLVTGKPELAKKIYDALINATVNETTPVILVSGKHYRVAKKIFEKVRERLREIRERHQKRLQRIREKLLKLKEKIRERCDYWLSEANKTIESVNTSVAQARYQLIEELHSSCINAVNASKPFLALRYLNDMKHEVRRLRWENRVAARSLFEEELEEESEDVSIVRERKMERWRIFRERLAQVVAPQKLDECRDLIEKLRKALREGDYEEARRIKVRIAERCVQVAISREGSFVPVVARRIATRHR